MMSIGAKQIYNAVATPTFRWAKVNELELANMIYEIPDDVLLDLSHEGGTVQALRKGKILLAGRFDGANHEMVQEVQNRYNSGYQLTAAAGETVRARFDYTLDSDHRYIAGQLQVQAAANSKVEIYLIFDGAAEHGGVNYLTYVDAAYQASVKIIKVQLHGENVRHIEHRYTRIAEDASVQYVNVEMGAQETIVQHTTDLCGTAAKLEEETIYLGVKSQRFDFSYLTNQRGKQSHSNLLATGALMDSSKKAFRGTIDFKRGAKGSEGAEEDVCLLLSPDVKSISLPLLLCKEDDVSGSHAASAGQIDREKMFYIMSRGFDEAETKHIIVESNMRPIIDKIGNEVLESRVLQAIRQKMNYCKKGDCDAKCTKRFPHS
jgi:Fe-S cluster assembly scaffold protein SufB